MFEATIGEKQKRIVEKRCVECGTELDDDSTETICAVCEADQLMNANSHGRWQEVPEPTHPIRTELLDWTKASRLAVCQFVDRQRTPLVNEWLEARTARYQQLFPEDKPVRLWHEAAADLVAWQRRMKAQEALEWVEDWEKH